MVKSTKQTNCGPIGYGAPPVISRFKKGQSGNPSGRPKGKPNLATVVRNALSAKVVVTEGGRRQTKSKLEVSLTQLANKAAGGDLNALRLILNFMPLLDQSGSDPATSPDFKVDRELAIKVAARLAQQSTNPSQGDDHE